MHQVRLSPGFQELTKENAGVGWWQLQAAADIQVMAYPVPTAAF